jgi:hypothetical protein
LINIGGLSLALLQGIIPCKAAKMASISVELMMTKVPAAVAVAAAAAGGGGGGGAAAAAGAAGAAAASTI